MLNRRVPVFKTVSKFQAVERDIAVLVAEHISHADLMHVIWSTPVEGVLRDAVLFDIYRPQASTEKSMAVRLTLNGHDQALTETQIDAAVDAIVAALGAQLGARQRA